MRIVQITDTHLSPIKPHFNRNWEPLVAWIDQQKPDLVIHTGDLTVDGAEMIFICLLPIVFAMRL